MKSSSIRFSLVLVVFAWAGFRMEPAFGFIPNRSLAASRHSENHAAWHKRARCPKPNDWFESKTLSTSDKRCHDEQSDTPPESDFKSLFRALPVPGWQARMANQPYRLQADRGQACKRYHGQDYSTTNFNKPLPASVRIRAK